MRGWNRRGRVGWGEAVTHASEYQHLSHAVNNDSAAALCLLVKPPWSLGESYQGNGEWNKSTVACQEGRGGGAERHKGRRQSKNSDLLCPVLNGHEWTRRRTKREEASLRNSVFTSSLTLRRVRAPFFFGGAEICSFWMTKKSKGLSVWNKVATRKYFLEPCEHLLCGESVYLSCLRLTVLNPPTSNN